MAASDNERQAVGYLRVAGTQDRLALVAQEAAIRDHCKAHDLRLVELTRDNSDTASDSLDTRDGLTEALATLRQGIARVLVVASLDHLAADIVMQETLLGEVRRHGGDIESCTPADNAHLAADPPDPTRKLARRVVEAVAECDTALTRLRLVGGRRRKIARGGFAGGFRPYGQAEGDEGLLDLVAELRRSGASYRAICEELTARGYHPRRGVWRPATVRTIAKRIGCD